MENSELQFIKLKWMIVRYTWRE